MFSFLKKIKFLTDKLQKNKALWFTFLSIISTLGIILSMYFITRITSGTEKEIYQNEAVNYARFYTNSLSLKYNRLYEVGYVVANDTRIIDAAKKKDTKLSNTIALYIQDSINMFAKNEKIFIKVYLFNTPEIENSQLAKLSAVQKVELSGIMIDKDGVFLKAAIPIMEKNTILGTVELKQHLYTLNNYFQSDGKEFAFLLKSDMLEKIDTQTRIGEWKKIDARYSVSKGVYTNKFYTDFIMHPTEELFKKEYIKDEDYFIVYQKVYDSAGREIGLAIFGEDAKKASSFVQITKSLVNSVITVALGLVISMILFMF